MMCIPSALITNGDFEAGNTGFSTDYTPSGGNLYPEGTYDVISNPNSEHGSFTTAGDHTTGSGLMMVINGHPDANKLVWGQTINVDPGTQYELTGWVMSVYPASPAQLSLTVGGSEIGAATAPSNAGVWQQFTAQFNSGGSTLAQLGIIDKNTERSGNDFALDDLCVRAVPEPSALAGISTGVLGLLSPMLRRRKNSA